MSCCWVSAADRNSSSERNLKLLQKPKKLTCLLPNGSVLQTAATGATAEQEMQGLIFTDKKKLTCPLFRSLCCRLQQQQGQITECVFFRKFLLREKKTSPCCLKVCAADCSNSNTEGDFRVNFLQRKIKFTCLLLQGLC